ncbi:MAG: inositol monophosphatase [Elusimicrobia bacterium]|nr:inositol monophosphatase [Elusimicrobiota bacterium]
MHNISEYFNIARKSVLESSKILKKYFFLPPWQVGTDYKGDRNPVTIADKKSENTIIRILRKNFPETEFLCEESCHSDMVSGRKLVWIIDPLDGTVNFVHKLPLFAISLALCKGKDVLLGIVYNPISKEFFHAIKGRGSYLNGKKIKVSGIKNIKYSLVVTGFPYSRGASAQKRLINNFDKFYSYTEGIRRLGSAASDLCYVACGRFEGFWEEKLNPWDVAAGSVILKEAGGKISDFAGGSNYIFGRSIIASNSKIHKKMLEIINNANKR